MKQKCASLSWRNDTSAANSFFSQEVVLWWQWTLSSVHKPMQLVHPSIDLCSPSKDWREPGLGDQPHCLGSPQASAFHGHELAEDVSRICSLLGFFFFAGTSPARWVLLLAFQARQPSWVYRCIELWPIYINVIPTRCNCWRVMAPTKGDWPFLIVEMVNLTCYVWLYTVFSGKIHV